MSFFPFFFHSFLFIFCRSLSELSDWVVQSVPIKPFLSFFSFFFSLLLLFHSEFGVSRCNMYHLTFFFLSFLLSYSLLISPSLTHFLILIFSQMFFCICVYALVPYFFSPLSPSFFLSLFLFYLLSILWERLVDFWLNVVVCVLLSTYLLTYLSTYLPTYLSIYFVCFICLFYLSINLFVFSLWNLDSRLKTWSWMLTRIWESIHPSIRPYTHACILLSFLPLSLIPPSLAPPRKLIQRESIKWN